MFLQPALLDACATASHLSKKQARLVAENNRLAAALRQNATALLNGLLVTTTEPEPTFSWPSLFCFEVVQAVGFELPLVKEQLRRSASIFSCDAFVVFSDAVVPQLLGKDGKGNDVMTVVIPPMQAAPGTSSPWLNTQTFQQVWDLLRKDGRPLVHDWTVKVDADTVLLAGRLRQHLRPHTEPGFRRYVVNCNRFVPVALYGSLEIFSQEAMRTYLAQQSACSSGLPWQGWGEDFYMSQCMDMLDIGRIYDFSLLADTRCNNAPCSDRNFVAYHGFKDPSPVGTWVQCWKAAGGTPSNPGGG